MNYSLLAHFFLFVIISCSCKVKEDAFAANVPSTPFISEVANQLQSALDVWAADPIHMGVGAAIILKNGEEWMSTAGVEDLETSIHPNHLIWMASITKTMTGAIILKLAEENKLSLDDPLSKWLSPLEHVNPEITIRQLLNHTNGLANYTRNPDLSPAIRKDSSHVFTATELLSFVGPKIFNAGERTQYTNTSFILLGLIAETVTNKKIVTLYHEMLWDPYNLSEIFLPGFESPPGPVATAWRGRPPEFQKVNPMDAMSLISVGNSAFGLFSNAKTIARWGHVLFGNDLLSENIRNQMLEFVPAAGNIPGESGAGLGIRKYNFLNRKQYGHSGGSPLGSSLMVYDPETGITVAVIMNQGGGADHFLLVPKLLKIASETE